MKGTKRRGWNGGCMRKNKRQEGKKERKERRERLEGVFYSRIGKMWEKGGIGEKEGKEIK